MATSSPNPPGSGIDPPGVRRLTLRAVMQPKDTNHYGTIFGGVILSLIDQAAFVEASRHGKHRWVTASVDRVDFKAPVMMGDIVNLNTFTLRTGIKSVTVGVEVEAQSHVNDRMASVTTATLTMVSVDQTGRPIPFSSPGTI